MATSVGRIICQVIAVHIVVYLNVESRLRDLDCAAACLSSARSRLPLRHIHDYELFTVVFGVFG
jgi:hypothetical protein